MATVQYPLVNFYFQVEWAGTRIGFTEVTGLSSDVDKIEYREGNSPLFHVTKMAGLRKYTDIVLKRGVFAGDNEFWQWLNNVQLNNPDRRDLTIKLLNETGAPTFVWTVSKAWPIKVEGPSLKSTDNTFSVESITLAVEMVVQAAN